MTKAMFRRNCLAERWINGVAALLILGLCVACIPKSVLGSKSQPPDIRGTIVELVVANERVNAIHVEGVLDADTKYDKASVQLTDKTRVFRKNGDQCELVSFQELEKGQIVEVLFAGLVLERYPVSAEAQEILITSPISQTVGFSLHPNGFPSRWEMVAQPVSDTDDLSARVYAMKITGLRTVIIIGVSADVSDEKTTIQLRDNTKTAKLISKNNLASLGEINFWVMEFEPRAIGSNELYLRIDRAPIKAGLPDRLIAKFAEPPEDPSVYHVRTYLLGAGQTFEQRGYTITFEGWGPPPSLITPPASELPAGVTVANRATLRIEEISGDQAFYLFVQFLSNGNSIGELIP